jgi:hypothetical protein
MADNIVKFPRRPRRRPSDDAVELAANDAMTLLQMVRSKAGADRAAELAYGMLLVSAGVVQGEYGADHAGRLLAALAIEHGRA